MDIDWKAELKRPVTLILAALALIGWIFALSEVSSKSALRASTTAQIGQMTTERQQLAAQLDQQQKASGTLADLQKRTAETTEAAKKATQDRDAAAADLAATNAAAAAAKQGRENAETQLNTLTQQLKDGRAAAEEAGSKLAQSKEAAAKLDSDAAARTGELADISKRIEAAHAQENELRQSLARIVVGDVHRAVHAHLGACHHGNRTAPHRIGDEVLAIHPRAAERAEDRAGRHLAVIDGKTGHLRRLVPAGDLAQLHRPPLTARPAACRSGPATGAAEGRSRRCRASCPG